MGGARVACDAYTDFLTREGARGGPGALRDRAEDGVVLGGLFAELNRREEAAACYAQAITHARMIGSTLLEGRVLHRQASMARRSGRMDEAAALYDASLRVLEAGGHHRRRAYALHNAGILAWEAGDIDLAEARVRASAALFEEIGQLPDAVEAVGSLVTYLLARGELSEAFARVEENIRFQRRAHDHRALTYGLLARGRILLERGEWDDARGDLEQVRLLAEAGSVRALRAATQYLGWLAHKTGRQRDAIDLYGSAISLADQHHEPIPAAVCAWWTEIAARGSVDASEVDGARSRGVDLGAWMRMAERPGPWSYDRRLTRTLIDVRSPQVRVARGR
jgi:tetratricopeptide (TPR) repeat protein